MAGIEYATFNDRMVNRVSLTGQYFITDARRVHNVLVGFLQGDNTENWIRNITKYQDGHRDMIALVLFLSSLLFTFLSLVN